MDKISCIKKVKLNFLEFFFGKQNILKHFPTNPSANWTYGQHNGDSLVWCYPHCLLARYLRQLQELALTTETSEREDTEMEQALSCTVLSTLYTVTCTVYGLQYTE